MLTSKQKTDLIKQLPDIENKWPMMAVRGKKVTVEQAKDIIRCVDNFFDPTDGFCGNDRDFEDALRKELNLKKAPGWGEEKQDESYAEYRQRVENCSSYIFMEHFNTRWISSCFVGGPYGWIHVDGEIYFEDNIGKWPTWEEIIDDLAILADRFPYLDMEVFVTCKEGGDDDNYFIGGIALKNGELTPILSNLPNANEFNRYELWSRNMDIQAKNTVVTEVQKSKFREIYHREHLFRVEEAVEYFKDYIKIPRGV